MNTDTDFTFDEYIMPTTYATSHSKLDLDNTFNTATYSAPLLNSSDISFLPTVFDLPDSPPASTPPLLSSSSTISEKIAKVNTLPDSFLPQFHQYSKESYENGRKKKAKRMNSNNSLTNANNSSKTSDDDSDEDNNNNNNAAAALEMRRQIHIQSEQKRRAQISDGFQELRQHLPGCINKKMSKAALLHRTVQHLQHLKKNQSSLLTELERLVTENEQLKKFQDSVLQKQALERMYHVSM
ncbi:uncharacterized protein BX664DRAFT_170954 [Halteromyces radiatus]|uniref:uncharacterized protein n=1 Tax=Halteromyces radiatus TaxID=101107 RepID=UPI00221F91BC|nr:uncharacterized protein BX664DRAFT_170954 [Halteromyces radiatus]KAI8084696.1 hypothetical protein BX664DRAFT_170954 [Halteromyces radiatus]